MREVFPNLLLLLASCCFWHHCCAGSNPEYNLRIYGGKPVNIRDVPYMARYQTVMDGGYTWIMCGAVIVHEQFLLTHAACTNYTDNEKVIVGTDIFDPHTGDIYDVEKVFMHPEYNDNTDDYNMGVVKLKKKLKLSDQVRVIKMADNSLSINPGDMMKTMGFGETEKIRLSEVLLLLEVPFVDRDTCGKTFSKDNHVVTERMICAGGQKGKGSAWADGGDPLVFEDHVVGLFTWAVRPFGQKSVPGIYSNVASMRDFIDDVINNNS